MRILFASALLSPFALAQSGSLTIPLQRKSTSEHSKRLTDSRTYLTNFKNFEYTGELYMGSQLQNTTFTFDTASDWLVVVSNDDCPDSVCNNSGYSHAESNSFKRITPETEDDSLLQYSQATAIGFEA